jgi:hypothetical protein
VIATCATCGEQFRGIDRDQLADRLWNHHAHDHLDEPLPAVTQILGYDWHRQALEAIRTLAATGKPFVISDVIELGVGDPVNPRTDWPKVTDEAKRLGWIEHAGFAQSSRPTARSSAVRQWKGTYAATRGAA